MWVIVVYLFVVDIRDFLVGREYKVNRGKMLERVKGSYLLGIDFLKVNVI